MYEGGILSLQCVFIEILKLAFKTGFWYKITFKFIDVCGEFTKVIYGLKAGTNYGIKAFWYTKYFIINFLKFIEIVKNGNLCYTLF